MTTARTAGKDPTVRPILVAGITCLISGMVVLLAGVLPSAAQPPGNNGTLKVDGVFFDDPTTTPTPTGTPSETPTPTPTPVLFSFDSLVEPPTCEEAGTLLQEAFPGVTITVDPPFDGPGTYTVTATLDDPVGTTFPDGTTAPKTRW